MRATLELSRPNACFYHCRAFGLYKMRRTGSGCFVLFCFGITFWLYFIMVFDQNLATRPFFKKMSLFNDFQEIFKKPDFFTIKVALGYGSCLPGSPWAAQSDGLIFDNTSTASAPKNKKCDSCTFSTYSNLKIKRRHHKTYWPLFCRQYGHSASFLQRLGYVGYDHCVSVPLAFMSWYRSSCFR